MQIHRVRRSPHAANRLPACLAVLLTVLALAVVCLATTAAASSDGGSTASPLGDLVPTPVVAAAPNLRGSYKAASHRSLSAGRTLTFTIHLHNSGTAPAVARVVDRVPRPLHVVPGSISPPAIADVAGNVLAWGHITVPVGGDVRLTFAVTTTQVPRPVLVTNTASISAAGCALERSVAVMVLPQPPPDDVCPPRVHYLIIDRQDVLVDRAVDLHILATDNVRPRWMLLREWQWATRPRPHWQVAQSTGWIPYQPLIPWRLGANAGTHFVGVWVADRAANVSRLDARSLDFASLLVDPTVIPPWSAIPYLVYYPAGVHVTAALETLYGDAQLFVWPIAGFLDSAANYAQTVDFITPRRGIYLFAAYSLRGGSYALKIDPPGGPRVPWWNTGWTDDLWDDAISAAAGAPASGQPQPADAPALLALLTDAGLDPLGAPPIAPDGPRMAYVPLVIR
jgi:uncharacterized repeat protein (TIGR01451 family)